MRLGWNLWLEVLDEIFYKDFSKEIFVMMKK